MIGTKRREHRVIIQKVKPVYAAVLSYLTAGSLRSLWFTCCLQVSPLLHDEHVDTISHERNQVCLSAEQ
jgi:hypothetical protein